MTTYPSSGRALRWTALGFVAGFLVHLYDHLRLGMSHTPVMVSLAGVLATVIGALAVVAVYADHPRAPLAATVAGLASAAGFAAVHFLPSWGPLSEPLHGHSDTPSWMSVTLATVTSAAFGVAGLLALRRTHVPATVGP